MQNILKFWNFFIQKYIFELHYNHNYYPLYKYTYVCLLEGEGKTFLLGDTDLVCDCDLDLDNVLLGDSVGVVDPELLRPRAFGPGR